MNRTDWTPISPVGVSTMNASALNASALNVSAMGAAAVGAAAVGAVSVGSRDAGSAGPGSAGLGRAGLGSAGLGSAGLGSAGLGSIALGTGAATGTAASGATAGGATAAAMEMRRPTPDPEERAVLICESQPITAGGVRALLEDTPPFKFAASCDSLASCRDLMRRVYPHVVILDKALGMQAILDWLADLRLASNFDPASKPHPPANAAPVHAIVWSVAMTEAEALRFLQAGAKGVIRKTAPAELLLDCLRTVASGLNWMEPGVFGDAARFERSSRSALTPREQQVMELVEQGLKNREIARELGIRPGTVKIHLKHIFEKTGVRGRYGLALSGMRQKGMIATEDDDE